MISFISFLGLSGHIKWILTLMPPGTISWMLAEMIFLESILCAIIFANVAVYRLALRRESEAKQLDSAVKILLLCGLSFGQAFLVIFFRHSWPALWVILGGLFILITAFVASFYAGVGF